MINERAWYLVHGTPQEWADVEPIGNTDIFAVKALQSEFSRYTLICMYLDGHWAFSVPLTDDGDVVMLDWGEPDKWWLDYYTAGWALFGEGEDELVIAVLPENRDSPSWPGIPDDADIMFRFSKRDWRDE